MKLTKSTHYTPEMEETHTVFVKWQNTTHVWRGLSHNLRAVRDQNNDPSNYRSFYVPKEEAEVYVALAKLKGECTESKYWYTINPKK